MAQSTPRIKTNRAPSDETDPLLKPVEVGRYIGLTTNTLWEYRNRGAGPAFVRLPGNRIRYRLSEVERWIGEHVEHPRGI